MYCVIEPRYTMSATVAETREAGSPTSSNLIFSGLTVIRISFHVPGRPGGRDDPLSFAHGHHDHAFVGAIRAQVDDVRDADEAGDERRRGPLVELTRPGDLLDQPLIHHRDPVGHRERFLLVVRDVHEGRLRLLLDVLELELHLLAQLQVEGAERLVEEKRRRAVHERPRQGNSLLLAARELDRLALAHPFELDGSHGLGHALLDFASTDLLDPEPEGDVLEDRHVREERVCLEDHVHRALGRRDMGHVATLEQNPAGRRLLEAGDHAEGRRLAATARAEEREELALVDRQVDVDHLEIAEELGDAGEDDVAVACLGCHRASTTLTFQDPILGGRAP